jgi:hypothetical protein
VSDIVQRALTQTNNEQESTAVVIIMCELRNTLVCCFDSAIPQITVFEIHEWIHTHLRVAEHSVLKIQIDGTRRQVFIKLSGPTFVHEILHTMNGTTEYIRTTGEIFPVRLEIAGMGTRLIRLASLPPELSGSAIRTALAPCGVIQSIHDETDPKIIVMR